MKDFPIRLVLTDEPLTPYAGLPLVGYLLHQTKLNQRLNRLRLSHGRRDVHISHSDVNRVAGEGKRRFRSYRSPLNR
ncbi:hypothetical protein B1A75_02575 [Geobacillus sp. LEMMY01]|nr:hypothetical protein B1A75_02575 [Geobacillus sp. LEMMY01]